MVFHSTVDGLGMVGFKGSPMTPHRAGGQMEVVARKVKLASGEICGRRLYRRK